MEVDKKMNGPTISTIIVKVDAWRKKESALKTCGNSDVEMELN